MPATFLSQIDALLALGFTLADDGTLTAPAGSVVTLPRERRDLDDEGAAR
jgi:hypothetical protein